jgi:outer membrane protein assembly factor BamB
MTVWQLPTSSPARAAEPNEELARLIISQMKARQGLAFDLGCGDGGLAMAVARRTDLIFECVVPDPGALVRTRQAIDAAGLYGTRVAVSPGNLARLEYPSHCASLILCGDEFVDGKAGRDFRELYRLLSPNGIAWIGQSAAAAKKGQALTRPQLEGWLKEAGIISYTIVEEKGLWARITRPRSAGWDEWTHRSHDPANTFGSEDTITGPHFKAQWVSDFRPGLSSAAVAVAGGRIVLASLSYDKFPETTPHIQVLDAYTGIELWARVGKKQLPIERPTALYSNRESCSDIAVVGDLLYLLGGKFCHVFDLANGELKQSLPIPKEAQPADGDAWLYLACVGDLLYGAVGSPPRVKTDWNTMLYRGVSKAVFALDRTTGRLRWINRTPASICSLCLGNGRLYFCDATLKLHALDAKTGVEAWSAPVPYPPGTVIAGGSFYRDKVWLLHNLPTGKKDRLGNDLSPADLLTAGHNSRELDAFSARDGKHLFRAPFGMKVAGVSFAGGQVFGTGQHGGYGIAVADVETGSFKWRSKENLKCTPSLAAPNCFLSQRAACASILDLRPLQKSPNPASATRVSFTGFRPSCSYPGIPANGMIYQQAEGCACASPIRGNMAFIPGEPAALEMPDRLEKGTAFSQKIIEEATPVWSTWRADHLRSAKTSESAPGSLELLWTTKLAGRVTPLAAGQGLVLCASSDRKIYALDTASGKPRWQHFAAGRIQAAPFLWRGRLFLTDDDGWAYCLRADQGDVVWKFRAALGEERIVGYGGFMSRWPARTGVLIHDDTAYFAAGFFPDEGTAVYAVDPRTGKQIWEKSFNTKSKGGRSSGYVPDGAMALAHNRLYIPSGSGMPWQVELDNPERTASFTPGTRVKGHQIMVAGDDLLAITPGLQYVHHVIYKTAVAPQEQLPVVTEATLYLMNQTAACYLIAASKEGYQLSKQGTSTYVPKKGIGIPVERSWRWKAWKNEPMFTLIATANTIFSGGMNKVYATDVKTGKELWSAAVPGKVEDLAFHGGRLFVQCDSGAILCFGRP